MYIDTIEAAILLEISRIRLRQLLQQNRVKGAYKCGRIWLIPLYNGMPQIIERKHGQKGTWKKSRKPKRTTVYVNRHIIGSNQKKKAEEREPVISVKGNKNTSVSNLEIPCPCRIIYSPDKPLYPHGPTLWIEVLDYDLEATLFARS